MNRGPPVRRVQIGVELLGKGELWGDGHVCALAAAPPLSSDPAWVGRDQRLAATTTEAIGQYADSCDSGSIGPDPSPCPFQGDQLTDTDSAPTPHIPRQDSPGSSSIRSVPERNASGGQVIGSIATALRRRSGRPTPSPV
jgi:hypothetical protein